MKVKVKFLDIPKVLCDDKVIVFKYQKAEAVFFYVAFHKSMDRYRVMSIFWPEEPEENARKNLRNALYTIRQAFGFQVLENIGQRIIALSDQIELETDLALAQESEGDFLQDYSLKDVPAFDDWLALTREDYRAQTTSSIKAKIKAALETDTDPEALYRRLLRLDPYDEETVRALMLHYKKTSQISRSIELYHQFEAVLKSELSLQPEPETLQLYRSILEKRRKVKRDVSKPSSIFVGRGNELARLNQIQLSTLEQKKSALILISGEAGIGKTTLITKYAEVASGFGHQVLMSTCFEGDENQRLSAWHPLVVKLIELLEQHQRPLEGVYGDLLSRTFPTYETLNLNGTPVQIERQDPLNFTTVLKGVSELILRARQIAPLILMFENIQWMDEWSLTLLCRLSAMSDPHLDVLFVATMRASGGDVSSHIAKCGKGLERYEPIELQRFTEQEARQLIHAALGSNALDAQAQSDIYNESEGNALYLVEIIKRYQEQALERNQNSSQIPTLYTSAVLPQKMRQIFSARWNRLSEEAKRLSELLSIFPEMISWEDIRSLTGEDELALLDLVESLIHGEIIREVPLENNELRYAFSHQKLKEFIYESQSATKRRLLHKRLGDYFRDQLTERPTDRLIYPKLIYHYERSGDKPSLLQYRILNLFDYLEMSHELFPRIRDQALLNLQSHQDFTPSYIEREIERIDLLMKAVPHEDTQGLIQLEYLNMISRYHLINGDSDLGYSMTQNMISLAKKHNRMDFVYKGYLQLIFNCINLRQIQEMEDYIRQAFQIFKDHADKGELGVLIRLKGYLMLLMHRFKYGEDLLISAAEIFSRGEYREPYALNLVASYYYLGESRRLQKDTQGALVWYQKAEAICRSQGFFSHLPLILCGKGTALYDAGLMPQAGIMLGEAVAYYDQLEFKWGQVPAYAYWALIKFREGNDKVCLEYLKKADQLVKLIGRVYETGLMLRIKAEICSLSKQLPCGKALRNYLAFSDDSYCRAAIHYFTDHPSFTYEKKVLQDIHEICGACKQFK